MAEQRRKIYEILLKVRGDRELRKLQTSVDRMERNTRKAQASLGRMSTQMSAAANTARALATSLVGVFGIQQIKNAINYGDAVAKTADKLGISTAALQEYRYAAEISGVATAAFDTALQRFTRRSAEAAAGAGELKDVYKSLGIDVRDAQGNLRDTEELLNDFADAIANTSTSSEQLRLAFKAFDTEGVALVNMLRDGSEGLERLRQAARDAGVVIEADLLRQSERLNDAYTKLSQQMRALLFPAFIQIADLANNVASGWRTILAAVRDADPWTKAAVAIGGVAVAFRALNIIIRRNPFIAIATAAVTAAGLIVEKWDEIRAFFEFKLPGILADGAAAFNMMRVDIIHFLTPLVQDVAELMDDVINQGVISRLNDFRATIGRMVTEATHLGRGILSQETINKSILLEQNLSKPIEHINSAAAATDVLNNAISDAASKQSEWAAIAEGFHQSYAAEIERIATESGATTDVVERMNAALAQTANALGEGAGGGGGGGKPQIVEDIEEVGEAVESVADTIKNKMNSATEDMVSSLVDGSKTMGQAFTDMLQGMLQDIASFLISRQVNAFLNDIFDAFAPSIGNMLSPGTSGGTSAGAAAVNAPIMRSQLVAAQTRPSSAELRKASAPAVMVGVTVHNNAGVEVGVTERDTPNGGKEIEVMLEKKVKEMVGAGKLDKTMRQVYGLKRRPA